MRLEKKSDVKRWQKYMEDYKDMNSNRNSDENVVRIAWNKFEEKHPKESRPEWLDKCISISETRNQNNNWIIVISMLPKVQLKPNQHWELRKGIPVLVEVDLITQERSIIICGGPAVDIEILFKAEVNLDDNSVAVLADTDLNMLDRNKYEIFRQ